MILFENHTESRTQNVLIAAFLALIFNFIFVGHSDAKAIYAGIYGRADVSGCSESFLGDLEDEGSDCKDTWYYIDHVPSNIDYTDYCGISINNTVNNVGRYISGIDAIALGFTENGIALADKVFKADQTNNVADWILDNYEEGDKIYIAGHSAGATQVPEVARLLNDSSIPVEMTAQFDSVDITWWGDASIPPNVKKCYNYYQRDTFPFGEDEIFPEDPTKTTCHNDKITNPRGPSGNSHKDIDNEYDVWRETMKNFIMSANTILNGTWFWSPGLYITIEDGAFVWQREQQSGSGGYPISGSIFIDENNKVSGQKRHQSSYEGKNYGTIEDINGELVSNDTMHLSISAKSWEGDESNVTYTWNGSAIWSRAASSQDSALAVK